MEREFIVKVILRSSEGAADGSLYIPIVIRAATAAAALATFAERSSASLVGALDATSDLTARGAVGADERVFQVVALARHSDTPA